MQIVKKLNLVTYIKKIIKKFLKIKAPDKNKSEREKIAVIYGAGEAGRKLLKIIEKENKYKVVAFIDDDKKLQGIIINNTPVCEPEELKNIVRNFEVTHIIIAIPSIVRDKKIEILDKLYKYKINILTLPTLLEIKDGIIEINQLKEIKIEDLLERKLTTPNEKLINEALNDEFILITGAGGSIGGELVRQIIMRKPKKVILVDMSEPALYNIENEINEYIEENKIKVEISTYLCNIRNKKALESIFKKERKISVIYHAAAYKHVPIVEKNICEGILNNITGTINSIELAIEYKVEKFILISTDKAVRPTNVMGATKRLSEMILQAKSKIQTKTRIAIVRFGNVLDSSGSVVPKFKEQIKKGGPVTLTHPDITRYFMTIPEATQLVLQASAIGGNGEVYLLNMGAPVKIKDLAKKMIALFGLKQKDQYGNGDIEIKITGLRPGEKLYEELLIGTNAKSTEHPDIYMGIEEYKEEELLKNEIDELINICNKRSENEAYEKIYKIIKI